METFLENVPPQHQCQQDFVLGSNCHVVSDCSCLYLLDTYLCDGPFKVSLPEHLS